MPCDIRPFDEPRDLEHVVNLYNTVFAPLRPYYSWPVSVERFRDKVLSHWEFRKEGLLLACDGPTPVGFVLAAFRDRPLLPIDVLTPEWSPVFLSAIAVAPTYRRRGVGRALVQAAAQFARANGRDRLAVACNPLAPMAFFIGVQDDWRDANTFFLRTGFDFAGMSQNMARSIVGYQPEPAIARRIEELRAGGYQCRAYQDGDFPGLLRLLDEHAWPYWHIDMLSKAGRWTVTRPFMETCFLSCSTDHILGPDEIGVVAKDGEVLSFCAQTINPQTGMAYLGPMLTQAKARNLGLGTVSLQVSLELAARKGATVCDLWTGAGGALTHFYDKSGFQPVLRWLDYRMMLR